MTEQFAALFLRGGESLLAMQDPLRAEMWATSMLGLFGSGPVSVNADPQGGGSFGQFVVGAASRQATSAGLAVLRCLGAVAAGPLGASAAAAARTLAERGVADPSWAAEIGHPGVLGAWASIDPLGMTRAHYAAFRYAGRAVHLLTCLYDADLGERVTDCFIGLPTVEPRLEAEAHLGLVLIDADPRRMAPRVLEAIARGDAAGNGHRSDAFQQTRALAIARMGLLAANCTSTAASDR